jgi:hypothetical protein
MIRAEVDMTESNAFSPDDEAAMQVLADIQRAETEILDLYQKHCRGPIGYQHFYLFGIGRRALAQSTAFRQLIADRNSLAASPLIRLQLDTVLRLYALFWVADPEDFARQVFQGTNINKLKARDGELLNDSYLKKKVAERFDWMPSVYRETSGYIHFSNRHMKAAVRMVDQAAGRAELLIGARDVGRSISYYGEMLRAFRHLTMIIPVAAGDWFSRLQDADEAPAVM